MTWPPSPKIKKARKPKRVVTHPEEDLQRAVVAYLKLALPEASGIVWSATLNGIRVSSGIRGKLKDLGTNPGVVLDICLIDLREDSDTFGCTFWMELKSPKGRPSSEMQGKVVDALFAAGRGCYVRSLDGCEAALRAWGLPIRCGVSA